MMMRLNTTIFEYGVIGYVFLVYFDGEVSCFIVNKVESRAVLSKVVHNDGAEMKLG